jgi:hypothetical protein
MTTERRLRRRPLIRRSDFDKISSPSLKAALTVTEQNYHFRRLREERLFTKLYFSRPCSSTVERAAHNRSVTGSNPVEGIQFISYFVGCANFNGSRFSFVSE